MHKEARDYDSLNRLINEVYGDINHTTGVESQITRWIIFNFQFVEKYLHSVDELICALNRTDLKNLPLDFLNTQCLKAKLGVRKLPTIEFLCENVSVSDMPAFAETMLRLRVMVRRNRLSFPIENNTLDSTQLVELIFYAYEEYVIENIEPTLPRGLLRSVFIEEASTSSLGQRLFYLP